MKTVSDGEGLSCKTFKDTFCEVSAKIHENSWELEIQTYLQKLPSPTVHHNCLRDFCMSQDG